MKKIIVLLLAFFVAGDILAQEKLYTAAIGVQAYTFRKSFPNGVAATLDSIKAMGITIIVQRGTKRPLGK